MRKFWFAVATVGFCTASGLVGATASAATVYDIGDDYSVTNGNPNGVWSYGQMTYASGVPDASTFTKYTVGDGNVLGTGAIEAWYTTPVDPNVSHNFTAAPYSNFGITWDSNEVSLGPGVAGEATSARFIAPAAGLYDISAIFQDNQANGGGADIYVYVNGSAVYTSNSGNTPEAGPAPYTGTSVPLLAGGIVDFIVGGANGATGNNTELDASITLVPEPAAGLIALGFLAAGLRRRK